jgi:hypothetical protein
MILFVIRTHSLLSSQKASDREEGPPEEVSGAISLANWLKDIRKPKESSSKLIIENDGRGSCYHSAFPVGGLRAPEEEFETTKRGRIASMSASPVPDVLHIQLPTGTEMPLDASSPKAVRRKLSSATPIPASTDLDNGTVSKLRLPDLGTTTASSKQQ